MTDMTEALLPCPFCGGSGILHDYAWAERTGPAFVECADCCVVREGWDDNTPGAAIAAWNRRATPIPSEVILAQQERIEALMAERDEVQALADRLRLEAQGHASEARTANSTIYEIYQVLSGGKGEKGNWNGAEPAREYVATAERNLAKAKEALRPFAEFGEFMAVETEGFSDTDRLFLIPEESEVRLADLFVSAFRRAREAMGD